MRFGEYSKEGDASRQSRADRLAQELCADASRQGDEDELGLLLLRHERLAITKSVALQEAKVSRQVRHNE